MTELTSRRRSLVLATVCLAAFAINLDTTIVNVALPDLGRELDATHPRPPVDRRRLQPGLRRAGADRRLARRPVRPPAGAAGRAGSASPLASGIGALVTSADALVVVRFAMGAFAALIFPTTLSIITNAFPDRGERAKAIGIWGAVTGLGVAVGPITGGLLLAHFGWPSVFVALVPVALVALRRRVRARAGVARPAGGAARPARPAPVVGRDRRARLHDHRGAEPRLDRPREPRRLRRRRRVWPSPSSPRAPPRAPDARRHAVPHTRLLGGERRGDGRVLRAVRLHLPGHAVLPVHPRLRHALDRRADPAGGDHHRRRLGGRRRAGAGRIGTRVVVTTGLVLFGSSFGWIALSHRRSCPTTAIVGADGAHGPRPRPDLDAGDRVDPQRPAAGQGRRRVRGQRRDPRGRRHARRRRARQHLHHPVRPPPDARRRSAACRPTSSRPRRTRSPPRWPPSATRTALPHNGSCSTACTRRS